MATNDVGLITVSNQWTKLEDLVKSQVSNTFTCAFRRTSFTGTQGTAPDLWNYTFGTEPTKTSCYKGAGNSLTSLTNYADIPTAWGGTA